MIAESLFHLLLYNDKGILQRAYHCHLPGPATVLSLLFSYFSVACNSSYPRLWDAPYPLYSKVNTNFRFSIWEASKSRQILPVLLRRYFTKKTSISLCLWELSIESISKVVCDSRIPQQATDQIANSHLIRTFSKFWLSNKPKQERLSSEVSGSTPISSISLRVLEQSSATNVEILWLNLWDLILGSS